MVLSLLDTSWGYSGKKGAIFGCIRIIFGVNIIIWTPFHPGKHIFWASVAVFYSCLLFLWRWGTNIALWLTVWDILVTQNHCVIPATILIHCIILIQLFQKVRLFWSFQAILSLNKQLFAPLFTHFHIIFSNYFLTLLNLSIKIMYLSLNRLNLLPRLAIYLL